MRALSIIACVAGFAGRAVGDPDPAACLPAGKDITLKVDGRPALAGTDIQSCISIDPGGGMKRPAPPPGARLAAPPAPPQKTTAPLPAGGDRGREKSGKRGPV